MKRLAMIVIAAAVLSGILAAPAFATTAGQYYQYSDSFRYMGQAQLWTPSTSFSPVLTSKNVIQIQDATAIQVGWKMYSGWTAPTQFYSCKQYNIYALMWSAIDVPVGLQAWGTSTVFEVDHEWQDDDYMFDLWSNHSRVAHCAAILDSYGMLRLDWDEAIWFAGGRTSDTGIKGYGRVQNFLLRHVADGVWYYNSSSANRIEGPWYLTSMYHAYDNYLTKANW